MKLTRSFASFALILSLSLISFLSLPQQTIYAQNAKIALQRGYRTGYSDGYMAGYRDVIDNAARSFTRHNEYTKADRAYNKDFGTLEDYRDGYQQGFESGYNSGYEKRSFDANLPTDLKRRAEIQVPTTQTPDVTVTAKRPDQVEQPPVLKTKTDDPINLVESNTDAIILIPTDTELILELNDEITTERSKEGDRFTAKVVSPMEIGGAIVEGRVSKVQKPGRIKRRAEILLTFDRIILNEARWSNFSAILTEVLPVKGDNVKRVDTEGTVEGKSSLKGDTIKVGAATGTGAVVGAVVGGPVGAAVGAGVGAAFGVGAVVVERGKHVKLNKLQQLRIKSTYETQIR
jgi:type IV secretion system protein VirB10